jgi:hypothetical protein
MPSVDGLRAHNATGSPFDEATVSCWLLLLLPVGNGPGDEQQAVATATDLARRLEPQIRQQLFPARPGQPALDSRGRSAG